MNKLLGNLLNCDLHLYYRQPQCVCWGGGVTNLFIYFFSFFADTYFMKLELFLGIAALRTREHRLVLDRSPFGSVLCCCLWGHLISVDTYTCQLHILRWVRACDSVVVAVLHQ